MTQTERQGRVVIDGEGQGEALVTQQPLNFTAAMCKPQNLLPGRKAEIRDAHHDLFEQNVEGRVLVFPACIGSTHTGLVLLDLVSLECGPAAMIVQSADSLLVSGVVLSDVWFDRSIPVIEYGGGDLFDIVKTGDAIRVERGTGKIFIGS